MKTEQLYKATFDHAVSGVSWKSGDAEYKQSFHPPQVMKKGDTLEIILDPAPAVGEYFVHVAVGDKNQIKGIVSPVPHHWAADLYASKPDLYASKPARGIDKFDYLLEEA